jgi:type IV pilus assembly protein PilA
MQDTYAATRNEEPEAGFTLIELMVVVLIIAILIAVMIPTFMGAKTRAQDRAAQSTLHNGFTAAKVVFSDRADYTLASVTTLAGVEPDLSWVDSSTASTGPNSVSVNAVSANYLVLAAQSKSGTCFFMSDDESAGGVGTQFASTGGSCTAGAAPAAGSASWTAAW